MNIRPRKDPLRHTARRGTTWIVPPCPDDGDPIDLDLSFTPGALGELIRSVGALPPESGAKLFGPAQRFGVDVVEFDARGSAAAGGAVYAPDTEWGSQRLDHWISQRGEEQRIWTGDAHSHPGGFGRPSQRSGPGLGDLGYVEAVFEQNEIQFEFCIPILTRTGLVPERAHIHPWVVLRSEPTRPRWARFDVRPSERFPDRRFNPAFEQRSTRSDRLIDLDLLAHQLRTRFGDHVVLLENDAAGTVEVDFGTVVVELAISDPSSVTATVLEGPGVGLQTGAPGRSSLEDRLGAVAGAARDASLAVAQPTTQAASHRAPSSCPAPAAPHGTGSLGIEPEAYYERTRGLLSEGFHQRSILVVGASGGSYLIEKLARLGPRRIVIADPDIVEVPNLVRTSFRTDQVGMAKVDALRSLIATANPFVEVETLPVDIMTLDREARDLLATVDLIVAGTDSFEAQATLNRWSQLSCTPAIFIGVHQGAAGGIVRWSVPGETACYRCMAAGRYQAAREGGEVDLPGEAGLLIDVQSIDMVAASLVVGLLDRGAPTPKGRLIDVLGDRTEIVITTTPDYPWGQELYRSLTSDLPPAPNREADLATYLGVLPIVTIPVRPNPSCPDCRLHIRHTPTTDLDRPDGAGPA